MVSKTISKENKYMHLKPGAESSHRREGKEPQQSRCCCKKETGKRATVKPAPSVDIGTRKR
jgi:hypothetical protein